MQTVKKRIGRRGTAPNKGKTAGFKVLIAARVSKTFHQRLQSECIRRESSLQELITMALQIFLDMPNEKYKLITLDLSDSLKSARTKLWSTYLQRMPDDKIEVMLNAMKWDLQMKKSARRKGK